MKTALKRAGNAVVVWKSADRCEIHPVQIHTSPRRRRSRKGSLIDWGEAIGEVEVIEVNVPDLAVFKALHDGIIDVMTERPDCQGKTQVSDCGPGRE
ncbi:MULTISPECIES: hypothetical protein [unclassified Nocardioides]|uniref:hypothetical protein n=1 Tax=unclassified Nocardioides TaxID=2615069 RepID=UPI001121AEAD|nr:MULTISPECIES: hypothetical protein [unclassified Nocardioides]